MRLLPVVGARLGRVVGSAVLLFVLVGLGLGQGSDRGSAQGAGLDAGAGADDSPGAKVAGESSPVAEAAPLTVQERTEAEAEQAARLRAEAMAAVERKKQLESAELEGEAKLVQSGARAADRIVPPGLSLAELTSGLAEAEAAERIARDSLAALEAQEDEREARQGTLPTELAQAEKALELAGAKVSTAAPEAAPELIQEWLAERELAKAVLETLQSEKAALEAKAELQSLLEDAAQRELKAAGVAAAEWSAALVEASQREADSAKDEAQAVLEDVGERFPSLASIAAENRDLAAARSGMAGSSEPSGSAARLASAAAHLAEAEALRAETERRRAFAHRRLRTGELTEGMAKRLRRDFEWLPPEAALRATEIELERSLTEAENREITLEEEEVTDPEDALQLLLLERGEGAEEEGWASAALALLRQKRDLQRASRNEAQLLQKKLLMARVAHGEASQVVESYREFLEGRIVWVRSAPWNPLLLVREAPGALLQMGLALGTGVSQALGFPGDSGPSRAMGAPPAPAALGLVGALLALALSRFLRAKLREMGDLTRSYKTDRFVLSVRALAQSLLLALPLPLALWSLGRWIESGSEAPLLRDLGATLQTLFPLYFVLRFTLALLTLGGLGLAHFRWRAGSVDHVRFHMRWLEPIGVLLPTVALTLDRHGVENWSNSIGRASFVLWLVAAAWFVHRTLGDGSPLWLEKKREDSSGMLRRTRRLWCALAGVLPLALAVLALAGYYYTALQFEQRLRASAYFLVALLTVYSAMLRWLFLSRRRLAVAQALEAREHRKKAALEGEDGGSSQADLDQVDLPAVDAQTRQFFKSSMTLASVLGLYLIWTSALPALQMFDRVQLLPRLAIVEDASTAALQVVPVSPGDGSDEARAADAGASGVAESGSAEGSPSAASSPLPMPSGAPSGSASEMGLPGTLTLGDVLLALIFIALTSVAVRNLPALLELAVLQRLPLDGGARYAITTIVRYVIIVIGVSAISGAVGVGWAQVQWLAAALTFGLAFGLQEIFANFVSGLIILIERPVRVGDIVTVGTTEGRVTQLRMRATTILDYDRREFLIPNKEFITSSVINWTLSDPVTRIVIPVGAAYGSDTALVRERLLAVAGAHRLVLKDPASSAIFRRFGDSTLDFELRVFIANRDHWPTVIDEVHGSIDRSFREVGIEIAFPQRDVQISGALELRSQVDPSNAGGTES